MEELNIYQWFQLITGTAAIIASIAVGFVSFVQNKHSNAMEKISSNHEKITSIHNTHSNRITAIESTLKSMPEFKNMEAMHTKMHEVDNKVAEINGKLVGITTKLAMIDQHLMEYKSWVINR